MKLKQITQLLFVAFSIVALGSCNDNPTYITGTASANAQIYSFSLTAKATNAIDSANFPVLATTRFSIDQFRLLIYNPDSLPYKTRLTEYLPRFTYDNPSKVEVIYPMSLNDSIVEWTTSDSIDFSLYPKIRVTAQDGVTKMDYTIDIRIHQVDPDSLMWTNVTASFELPATIRQQKTFLVGNAFYAFSIGNDNAFYLDTISKSATSPDWKRLIPSVIPASVKLESITRFNGRFYAVDGSDNSYSSADGVTWEAKSTGVRSILGVLPAIDATKDSLLVITDQNVFAKTLDMQALKVVDRISFNTTSNEVPPGFPAEGFTSVTNYDRSMRGRNILAVTAANLSSNLTWSLRQGEGRLEVASNQVNLVFTPAVGICTFLYNEYIYALTANVLYRTNSFGSLWVEASAKEVLYPEMPKASGQSVIVDSDNYIWIFGGTSSSGTPVRQVWKGRINRLAR
jgi:hypothetical protein